jgi:transposase InsO family protein
MQIYQVGQALERIAVDIQGPYVTSKKGNKYILVTADYFTKWIQALPLKSMEASYVAMKIVDKFISNFGVPLELFSDRGSNFESNFFQEMCSILGIHKTKSTVGRRNSDGIIERAHRTLENMISAYVDKNQKKLGRKPKSFTHGLQHKCS